MIKRQINEVFTYNTELIKTVKRNPINFNTNCDHCYFAKLSHCSSRLYIGSRIFGKCNTYDYRSTKFILIKDFCYGKTIK